jgi:hypothetical protein
MALLDIEQDHFPAAFGGLEVISKPTSALNLGEGLVQGLDGPIVQIELASDLFREDDIGHADLLSRLERIENDSGPGVQIEKSAEKAFIS